MFLLLMTFFLLVTQSNFYLPVGRGPGWLFWGSTNPSDSVEGWLEVVGLLRPLGHIGCLSFLSVTVLGGGTVCRSGLDNQESRREEKLLKKTNADRPSARPFGWTGPNAGRSVSGLPCPSLLATPSGVQKMSREDTELGSRARSRFRVAMDKGEKQPVLVPCVC
ncbi:hypothetical protein VTI74DRAFT_6903 [Chaetomium olivicolor]